MKERYSGVMEFLQSANTSNWTDITNILQQFRSKSQNSLTLHFNELIKLAANGTAFYTFEFGIDGVSIEISKYAQALETLYQDQGKCAIHLIAERFHPEANFILDPRWSRYQIEGINGWAKWDDGKWFQMLFYEDMPNGSSKSDMLAREIFTQAVKIAQSLFQYLFENHIYLLIPVNVASNPGNMAATLALILVSEALETHVINSNHDFYWEGGKPDSEKKPRERTGSRDHFFRNYENRPFFELFEMMYPWNGERWIQVTINKQQSKKLVRDYGFPKNKVFEISTSVNDRLLEEYTDTDTQNARIRMAYILSDGEAIMHPIPVNDHIAGLKHWMGHQTPCILGLSAGLYVDPGIDELIYFLQPTRILPRKRIERDLELIAALVTQDPFREYFRRNSQKKIILHVTGPTPIEHRVYLKRLLNTYSSLVESLPTSIADRIFLAFSVGHEDHPALKENSYPPLTIEEIYRMATVVLLPSGREGRGLPIIESCASGIPIICNRYKPVKVFDEVIGEGLPEEQKILYTPFPKKGDDTAIIKEIAELLINPQSVQEHIQHNKKAVRVRYSREALTKSFERYFEYFFTLEKTYS